MTVKRVTFGGQVCEYFSSILVDDLWLKEWLSRISLNPVQVRVKRRRTIGTSRKEKRRDCWIRSASQLQLTEIDPLQVEKTERIYQEGLFQKDVVASDIRKDWKKSSFERDIGLLAVRWFQRRRGTELKRQFYRHREAFYSKCFQQQSESLQKRWLRVLQIPEHALESLSLKVQKDWFLAEVCRILHKKRYSLNVVTKDTDILVHRLRLEVARLGNIRYLNNKDMKTLEPLTTFLGLCNLGNSTGYRKLKGTLSDIILLDDYHFSDATCLYSVLEVAVQSLNDYGLLCLHMDISNCILTDDLKELPFAAELRLRIFLDQLQRMAFIHERYLEPVFSCILEGKRAHLWLRVRKDLYGQRGWTTRSGLLYYCSHCFSYKIQPLEWTRAAWEDIYGVRQEDTPSCDICDAFPLYFGGSIFTESLCQVREMNKVVQQLIIPLSHNMKGQQLATLTLANPHDMEILFSTIAAEGHCSPFFLDMQKMESLFQLNGPSMEAFCKALMSRGYQAVPSHTCLSGVKTNAPLQVVWDVWKSWKLYCEPNSNHHLLQKPLIHFSPKEWNEWINQDKASLHWPDERVLQRLHHPEMRYATKLEWIS
eukprot:jgi/Galph1/3964/GphlegSOOS_G2579.1